MQQTSSHMKITSVKSPWVFHLATKHCT